MSFLGIVLFAVLVLGKTFYIQRFQGNYWRSMSDSLHQKIESIDAERGTIFSEDGQMLSTSIPTFDIYIDFNAEGSVTSAVKNISFNLAAGEIFGLGIRGASRRFTIGCMDTARTSIRATPKVTIAGTATSIAKHRGTMRCFLANTWVSRRPIVNTSRRGCGC